VVMTALPRLATTTDAAQWEKEYQHLLDWAARCKLRPGAVHDLIPEPSGAKAAPSPDTNAPHERFSAARHPHPRQ
jgi:hypothetical protein